MDGVGYRRCHLFEANAIYDGADLLLGQECGYVREVAEPHMTASGVALMDHDRGKEATNWRTSTTYFMPTRVRERGSQSPKAAYLTPFLPLSYVGPAQLESEYPYHHYPHHCRLRLLLLLHGSQIVGMMTCLCGGGGWGLQGHKYLEGIDQRVADLTRQPISHQEHVQVLRYEQTQRWVSHRRPPLHLRQ